MSKVIQTAEELDAVLHWRRKHAQAARALDAAKAREDALQQRLTAADERLEGALRTSLLAMKSIYQAGYDSIVDAGGTCDTPEYMMAHDPTARELRALLDAPAPCAHEWTDDGEFTLTCTKCGKTENHEPYGWVQTRGDAINHFTQEWDVVESWEDRGFQYKAMFDRAEQPAAQPQGEPVAWRYRECEGAPWRLTDMPPSTWYFDPRQYEVRNLHERPAPAAMVPDGYCIMPRQLTAENGAKALLLGEFNLQVTMECPECCELEEPAEGCSICDGEGEYGQKHTIPWDQIKFIYSKAVSGLAVKAEPAKSQ